MEALQFVIDAIQALDLLPATANDPLPDPRLPPLPTRRPLISDYGLLCLLQDADQQTLDSGKFADDSPVAPNDAAAIRERMQHREATHPWGLLPWGRQRVAKLLAHYLDDPLQGPPHIGFGGPRAGTDELAGELRIATSIEWLLYCPQRCDACRMRCLRDLERLRKALVAEAEKRNRRNPPVTWRRLERSGAIEVSDGSRSALLKGNSASLFLAVSEHSPRHLTWHELILSGLAAAGVKLQAARTNRRDPRQPRMTMKKESAARAGRRLREELDGLGHFWHQDSHGASWQPPEGSAPIE